MVTSLPPMNLTIQKDLNCITELELLELAQQQELALELVPAVELEHLQQQEPQLVQPQELVLHLQHNHQVHNQSLFRS